MNSNEPKLQFRILGVCLSASAPLRSICFVLLAASIAWSAGCGASRRDEPFTRPLAVTDAKLAQGQKSFAANCNECHPGGAGGAGPALNDKALPGPFIKFQVRTGLGAMPAFDKNELSDQDLDAVVYYLQSLKKL